MRSMRSRLACLVSFVALSLLLSAAAGGTTIDNFEQGSFSPLIDTSPGAGATGSTQSGLSTSNTIGGERRSNVFLTSGTQASASLTLSGGDDGVLFDVNPSSTADVEFTYLLVSVPVDITTGGQTGFEVTLASAPTTGTIFIEATDSSSFIDTQSVSISGAGDYTIAFNLFLDGATPVDFANLETLRVGVEGTAGGSTLSYTISNVTTVPEPGTGLLLSLGLAVLAVRRSRPAR